MTEKEAFLILNALPELGSARIRNLIKCFGKAEAVLNANELKLKEVEGLNKKAVENILNWKKLFNLKNEKELLEKHKVSVVAINENEYPLLLKEIYDPPVVLYIKGSLNLENRIFLAIIGARSASYYGINTARRLARELSGHGCTIVSGFARGIDTAAHEGALQGDGNTIAVFGCGLDIIYPPENSKLADKVILQGAVVSEYPFGTPPVKYNFPKRNRIISGLCQGVIVVEAGKYSGSLITARLAAEQGRDVFSVPGRIDAVTSQGTNILIKNGAKPVLDIEDIIEELDYSLLPNSRISERIVSSKTDDAPLYSKDKIINAELSSIENKILECLDNEQYTVDEIFAKVNLPVNDLWNILVKLELKGIIKRFPGSKFSKR